MLHLLAPLPCVDSVVLVRRAQRLVAVIATSMQEKRKLATAVVAAAIKTADDTQFTAAQGAMAQLDGTEKQMSLVCDITVTLH